MASAVYGEIKRKPFVLPDDFIVEGTDIVRCEHNPRMGYLNPREGVVYAFLIEKAYGTRHLRQVPASTLEREFRQVLPNTYKIIFASPRIDQPELVDPIDEGDIPSYITVMHKVWKKSTVDFCRKILARVTE